MKYEKRQKLTSFPLLSSLLLQARKLSLCMHAYIHLYRRIRILSALCITICNFACSTQSTLIITLETHTHDLNEGIKKIKTYFFKFYTAKLTPSAIATIRILCMQAYIISLYLYHDGCIRILSAIGIPLCTHYAKYNDYYSWNKHP
jgi:hypothetical protein